MRLVDCSTVDIQIYHLICCVEAMMAVFTAKERMQMSVKVLQAHRASMQGPFDLLWIDNSEHLVNRNSGFLHQTSGIATHSCTILAPPGVTKHRAFS
jgi:hypothetical protein